jgi:taurine dioxygenase
MGRRVGGRAGLLWRGVNRYHTMGPDATVESIREALHTHGAVAFRSLGLTEAKQFEELVKCFGWKNQQLMPVDKDGALVQLYHSYGRAGRDPPESARGSDHWHSDNSYNFQPAFATSLYAVELPKVDNTPGTAATDFGGTWLCDGARAYDALPTELQDWVLPLYAEHSSGHNGGILAQTDAGPTGSDIHGVSASHVVCTDVHPVVRRHPYTGRPCLYVNPCYTMRLMQADKTTPVSSEMSKTLLQRLYRHMLGDWEQGSPSEFCRLFQWQSPGDMLVWDNARMLHRATTLEMPSTMQRRMLRASLKGPPVMPFEDQDGSKPTVDADSDAPGAVFDLFESLYASREPEEDVVSAAMDDPPRAAEQNKGEVLAFLKNQLHLLERDVKSLLKKCPDLFSHTVDEAFLPVTEFLRKEVGMKDRGLTLTLKKCPQLFLQDVQRSRDTFQFLFSLTKERLNAPGFQWFPLITASPRILLTPVEKLVERVELICSYENAELLLIIKGHLPVLMRDTDLLMQMFDFLEWVGFDRAACGELVSLYPMLLTHSPDRHFRPMVDLLRSKGLDPADKSLRGLFAWPNPEVGMLRNARFLCDVAGYDEDMLWSNPMVLVYSFEQRVEPRVRFVLHLWKDVGSLTEMSHVKTLTMMDDLQFCTNVGSTLEEYRRFVQGTARIG